MKVSIRREGRRYWDRNEGKSGKEKGRKRAGEV